MEPADLDPGDVSAQGAHERRNNMAISKRKNRILAVLHMPRSVPEFVAFAESVVRCMKNSPHFPDPTPPLELVTKATDELRRAQELALLRTLGAAQLRDEKLATVGGLLGLVRGYVQGVADLDVEQGLRARSVIRSAGLTVRKEMERRPVQFYARLGDEPGLVKIGAPSAAKTAAYEWEYSVDRGRTWKELPSTMQSRTTLSCPKGQGVVEIRYRAITRAGEGPWSGVIAIFVP
jgi:hypothetical protein